MDNTQTVVTLNYLLNITNDRILGFNKVEEIVWQGYPHLKNDYDQMVNESQTMKSDLIGLITERGGEADNTATTAGAIHRTWIDLKNSLAGNNAESTLENVVFGEQAAIDSYQEALQGGDLCLEKTVKLTTQFRCKLTTSFGSN